jgi:hypothetical protein
MKEAFVKLSLSSTPCKIVNLCIACRNLTIVNASSAMDGLLSLIGPVKACGSSFIVSIYSWLHL